jgi:hypothetical protein
MTWVWVLLVPVAFALIVYQMIAWIDLLLDRRGEARARRRYAATRPYDQDEAA